MNVAVEIGRVSKHLNVLEVTIRAIALEDAVDLAVQEVADKSALARNLLGLATNDGISFHLQGHLENASGGHLGDVKYDVSFYSQDGTFLGLSRAKLVDDDEMEP